MNYTEFRGIFLDDEIDLETARLIVEALNESQIEDIVGEMEMDPAKLRQFSMKQRVEAAALQRKFSTKLNVIKDQIRLDMKSTDDTVKSNALRQLKKIYKVLGQLQIQTDILDPPKLSGKTVNELFSIGRTQETLYPEDDVFDEIESRMEKHHIKRYQQGPLNLKTYTTILKTLVEAILDGHVLSNIGKDGNYILRDLATSQDYDVLEILKHANLSHITLDDSYLDKYVKFTQGVLQFKPSFVELPSGHLPAPEDFTVRDIHDRHFELHYGEKLGINVYTGSAYAPINNLLRLAPNFDDSDHVAELKELLVHSVVCASGLNRTMEKYGKFVFRGDSALPKELLEQRKKDAAAGVPTYMRGFISTSTKNVLSETSGDVRSVYSNGVLGVDISALSYHAHEAEVLLLPGHVIWEGSKEEGGVQYFQGRTTYSPSFFVDEKEEQASPTMSVKHN